MSPSVHESAYSEFWVYENSPWRSGSLSVRYSAYAARKGAS